MNTLDDEYDRFVDNMLADTRERSVAVATARLIGEDDELVCQALIEHLARLGPDLLRDMLSVALWHGGRSAEREARTRLMQLRDAKDIPTLVGGAS